jgi:hypothetical protein
MGICPNGGLGVPKKSGTTILNISVDLLADLIGTEKFNYHLAILFGKIDNGLSGLKPIWYEYFSILHSINPIFPSTPPSDLKVNLTGFCTDSPNAITNSDVPTWDELYGTLIGLPLNKAQFLEKMAKLLITNAWYKLCKCKSELEPLIPLPLPDLPPTCPPNTHERYRRFGLMWSFEHIAAGYSFDQAFNGHNGNICSTPFAFALRGNTSEYVLLAGGGTFASVPWGFGGIRHIGNVAPEGYDESYSLVLVPEDGSPPINIGESGFPDVVCDFDSDPTPPPIPKPNPTGSGLPCPECQSVVTETFNIELYNDKDVLESKEVSLLRLEPEETTPDNQLLIDLLKTNPEYFETTCTPCPETEDVSISIETDTKVDLVVSLVKEV